MVGVRPSEEIRLVKENLSFAVAFWKAAAAGSVPPDPLLRPAPTTRQFNQPTNNYRQESELSAELTRGAANQMRAAFALSALQTQRSLTNAFPGEPIQQELPELRAALSAMHLIGLAVQNSILQPVWNCPSPYRRLFQVRRLGFTLNATGLTGRPLSWDDFGGLDCYLSLLEYCAASADAAPEKTPNRPQTILPTHLSQTKHTGLISAPQTPTNNTPSNQTPPPKDYPGEQPPTPPSSPGNPTHPENQPAHPTDNPTHPDNQPAHLTDNPTHPDNQPAHLTDNPAHPDNQPAHLTDNPAHPENQPAQPTDNPTHPKNQPDNLTDNPAHPENQPAQPTDNPTHPKNQPDNPAHPDNQHAQPTANPTHPKNQPDNPAHPDNQHAQPTDNPTHPKNQPDNPAHPDNQHAQPTDNPANPTNQPANSTSEPPPTPNLPKNPPDTTQNPIDQFITQHCETGPEKRILAGELYAAFLQWCHDTNQNPPSQRAFGMRLTTLGLQRKRRGHGKHWWQGIHLTHP